MRAPDSGVVRGSVSSTMVSYYTVVSIMSARIMDLVSVIRLLWNAGEGIHGVYTFWD